MLITTSPLTSVPARYKGPAVRQILSDKFTTIQVCLMRYSLSLKEVMDLALNLLLKSSLILK